MASVEQGQPAAVIETEPVAVRVSYVLGRLDRALRHHLDAALKPCGVTTPQFTALSVLRRREALSNAQLARRSLITPQSMYSVLKALERKGLIERTPSPDHRRILYTRLTDAGRDQLARCDEAVDAVEDRMLADFSAAERSMLLALATRGVRNLRAGLEGKAPLDESQVS